MVMAPLDPIENETEGLQDALEIPKPRGSSGDEQAFVELRRLDHDCLSILAAAYESQNAPESNWPYRVTG